MNPIFRAIITPLLIFAVCSNRLCAQFTPSKFEIGINAGTLIYQGDLSASALGYTKSLKPSVGIWASKSLDDYLSLRANIVRGAIGADESTYASPAWRRHRNFAFSTSVTEFSTVLVWDLLGKTYGEGMRRLSPYFFIGAGFTILNVKRDWSRFDTSYFNSKSSAAIGLGIDTLHKTPWIVGVIPVGAGIRYMLTNHIYLNVEGTYRFTGSDYIDGFKYAGNPKRNDQYYGLSIGASYRFGSDRMDCPKVRF
jgi:hypothetical protein